MVNDAPPRLRADAARNAARILQAARAAYADTGPDASMEQIADRAGVALRTLYRRYPNKEELARAALTQSIAEGLTPAIDRALQDEDPLRGIATAIEAAIAMAARDINTLTAARNAGALTGDLSTRFYEALAILLRNAQQQGLVRDDLVTGDLRRLMVMLVSVLWATDPGTEDWRRYLALLLDALSPAAATPLPPSSSDGSQ